MTPIMVNMPKDKLEAVKTMMVTLLDQTYKEKSTFLVKNFDVEVHKRPDSLVEIILHTDGLAKSRLIGECGLYVLATKDPTPKDAGSAVSLGYYLSRWVLKRCKMVSRNPFVFLGHKDDYAYEMLLEMWE